MTDYTMMSRVDDGFVFQTNKNCPEPFELNHNSQSLWAGLNKIGTC